MTFSSRRKWALEADLRRGSAFTRRRRFRSNPASGQDEPRSTRASMRRLLRTHSRRTVGSLEADGQPGRKRSVMRRSVSIALIVCVALSTAVGCSKSPRTDEQQTTGAAAQRAPGSETQQAGMTGILSEEQFKALHHLKTEAAPPLQGQMIDLAGGHAYLSLPPNAKPPLPGIVVIQEWWGLNDHIKHWSDRLAAAGYAALAVDLYGGKVETTAE